MGQESRWQHYIPQGDLDNDDDDGDDGGEQSLYTTDRSSFNQQRKEARKAGNQKSVSCFMNSDKVLNLLLYFAPCTPYMLCNILKTDYLYIFQVEAG